jgi:hypothetical protein
MSQQQYDFFDLPGNQTKAQFLEVQRAPGQWGDVNTIKAAALRYRRVIHVASVDEGVNF